MDVFYFDLGINSLELDASGSIYFLFIFTLSARMDGRTDGIWMDRNGLRSVRSFVRARTDGRMDGRTVGHVIVDEWPTRIECSSNSPRAAAAKKVCGRR